MKRTTTFISLLLVMAACASAQPVAIYDRTEQDFGTILWKEPVSAKFTVTNRGNQPLVITYVSTDCGCTDAQWTQSPIAPGASGEVTATFDAGLLGRFHKSIGIYSNAEETPTYLMLTGTVATQLENYDETFPYIIGNLRLDRTDIDMGDCHKGGVITAEVNVVNTGDGDYEPFLIHQPAHIRMEAVPAKLGRKQTGKLRFVVDTDKLTHLGLTQTDVNLARYLGDKVGEDNRLVVSTVLLPDFSALTAAQRAQAPDIQVSATDIDFGRFGEKMKLTQTVTLTNTGQSTLKIKELQVSDLTLSVHLKKSELRPGESTKLKIHAQRKYMKQQHPSAKARVLLITNAPSTPKVVITARMGK